jgi:hypothetical protein
LGGEVAKIYEKIFLSAEISAKSMSFEAFRHFSTRKNNVIGSAKLPAVAQVVK